jgi:SAM-dependent methyltransferase
MLTGRAMQGAGTMGIVGGEVGYRLLKYVSPGRTGNNEYTAYQNRGKVETLFGPGIWDELAGKVVIDFGCECGDEAIDIARHGSRRVIGTDIRPEALAVARERAALAGVADRCEFTSEPAEKADVIVSFDAFEHFQDPAATLRLMRRLLADGGYIRACFGPTWYHPLGGHGFSVFPWAHLVFTERAILKWYGEFSGDPATCFSEIRGGLNQMTIRRFEQIVAESEFRFGSFEAVPIRKLKRFHNRLTREFTTAVVKCTLVPRDSPATSIPAGGASRE